MRRDKYMDDKDLKLLTVDEVREIIRMSNDSIRKHIRNGKLKAKKCGVKYLIKTSDLKDFIENNRKEVDEEENA
jgi:excisionase family DNA binding protein